MCHLVFCLFCQNMYFIFGFLLNRFEVKIFDQKMIKNMCEEHKNYDQMIGDLKEFNIMIHFNK